MDEHYRITVKVGIMLSDDDDDDDDVHSVE